MVHVAASGQRPDSSATTFSTDASHKWGSCGFPLPGTEVAVWKCDDVTGKRIERVPLAKNYMDPSEGEQGELCFRGRHVMMGYLANKSMGKAHLEEIEKKTAAAIDEEGWLHSGDKACMDEDG